MKAWNELTKEQQEQVNAMFDPRLAGDPSAYLYELGNTGSVLCRKKANNNSDDWAVIETALKEIQTKNPKVGALSAGELVLALAEVIKAMPEHKFQAELNEVRLVRQIREKAEKEGAAVPRNYVSSILKIRRDARKSASKAKESRYVGR